MKGSLFLIPVTLGGAEYRNVIPEQVIETARSLRFFVVEEIRTARRFLRMIDRQFPIDGSSFGLLNEHTNESEVITLLGPALEGHNIGLMSEAGLPAIADPGSRLVAAAHRNNIRVIPMSGPSSIILALIASGFNGQQFMFHGYLPVQPAERNNRIKELEKNAMKGISQIFMETPYRAQKTFEAVISVCNPETSLCVAADITLPAEEIRSAKILEWRSGSRSFNDRLVVFLLGK